MPAEAVPAMDGANDVPAGAGAPGPAVGAPNWTISRGAPPPWAVGSTPDEGSSTLATTSSLLLHALRDSADAMRRTAQGKNTARDKAVIVALARSWLPRAGTAVVVRLLRVDWK